MAVGTLLAQHIFNKCLQPKINHVYKVNSKRETLDSILVGPHKLGWNKGLKRVGAFGTGNEYGVKSTDTIDFIPRSEIPSGQSVTYASFVLDYRPLKSEPYRIRITVGGDKLEYFLHADSPAANMLETKILLNSVISDADRGARFMSADMKYHYLMTPMDHYAL